MANLGVRRGVLVAVLTCKFVPALRTSPNEQLAQGRLSLRKVSLIIIYSLPIHHIRTRQHYNLSIHLLPLGTRNTVLDQRRKRYR